MHIYIIRYNSPERGTCFDTEMAANQVVAYDRFRERKPSATDISIKSRSGVWVKHHLLA